MCHGELKNAAKFLPGKQLHDLRFKRKTSE
jgi:hypothetical protein